MNILVEAFLDRNFGDDVFLDILFTRYPEANFYLLYDQIQLDTKYHNVKLLSFFEAVEQIDIFDCYLIIGGSMFPNAEILQDLRICTMKVFKLENKSILILGINLHNKYDHNVEAKIIEQFKLSSVCTVRDKASFDFLTGKFAGINVKLAADIAFARQYGEYEANEKNKYLLGISVMRKLSSDELSYKNYCEWISKFIKRYLSLDINNKVRLFAFSTGYHDDGQVINDIAVSEDNRIDAVKYEGDIGEFLNKFSECSQMLTTRFHSLIFSLIYGMNFLPIVYENKTDNVLDEINYSGIRLDYDNIETVSIEDTIRQLIRKNELYDAYLLSKYKKRSAVNFDFLDI